MYAQRLRAAATATADAGLAGLVITAGYDLRYLIGSRAQTFERLTALPASTGGRSAGGTTRAKRRGTPGESIPSRPSSFRGWNWPR